MTGSLDILITRAQLSARPTFRTLHSMQAPQRTWLKSDNLVIRRYCDFTDHRPT